MSNSSDRFLTPGQVARITGISRRTLGRWRNSAQRLGPPWIMLEDTGESTYPRYSERELWAWIERRKQATNPQVVPFPVGLSR